MRVLEIKIGTVINKVYEVLKQIHVSQNSQIYRAYDNLEDKFVIIKFLEKSDKNKESSELFRREVRSLENIDNQYVIRLLTSGEQDGFYYLVMEQVHGALTLEAHINSNYDELGLNKKLEIFKKILLGIEEAHEMGVSHRDLNPTNILINDDEVKIIDFGISKIKKFIYEEKFTVSNHFTLGYASPEQLNGDTVGFSSDIFSLGAILYFILTNASPSTIFEERMAMLAKTSISDELLNIVRKCTESKIENRYKSVRSIINDLDLVVSIEQAQNEVVYIKISDTVVNQLYQMGVITFQRTDSAYRAIINNLKESYVYIGGKSDIFVLIGNMMKYYCEFSVNTSIIFIRSCEKIEGYPYLMRERKKAVKINATIVDGSEEDNFGRSEYLSTLVKQVNDEAAIFRAKQKNQASEMRLMELWQKTISAQDKIIQKKSSLGEYQNLNYIPESNLIEMIISDLDSYEKLDQGNEIAVRKRNTTNFIRLGTIEDVNTEENIIHIIPKEKFDFEEYAISGPFGIDVSNSKSHNEKFKKALESLKYRKSENKKLLDILINPNTAKYDKKKILVPINKKIDSSNFEVVEKALVARDMFLIQGPPGTGKTTVIEEIVNQIMKGNKNAKILIASQSHVAVDNILIKLAKHYDKSQIVRLGNSVKIAESSEENKVVEQTKGWTETIKEQSVLYAKPMLENMAKPIEYPFSNIFAEEIHQNNMTEEMKNFNNESFIKELVNNNLREYTKILKDWYKKLNSQEQFDDLLVSRANIVCSTCTGSANLGWVTNNTFNYVIIDEAAKSTFPEVIIPMVRGEKIILVGDHKQLPPIVNNIEDEKTEENIGKQNSFEKGLEKSLFEELFDKLNNPDIAVSLSKQFRMHPNIAEMIKKVFYTSNELESGVDVTSRANYSRWGNKSIVWLSTSLLTKRREYESENKAFSNIYEAQIIKQELEDLNQRYSAENKTVSVGVISGYNGQKSLLRKIIKPEDFQWTNLEISIENVDAYQGTEVDIVFHSVVRSNDERKIGFLKDNRRLNVSLSRAKNLLVIVGDDLFLENVRISGHNYFNDVLTYIKRNPSDCIKEDIL